MNGVLAQSTREEKQQLRLERRTVPCSSSNNSSSNSSSWVAAAREGARHSGFMFSARNANASSMPAPVAADAASTACGRPTASLRHEHGGSRALPAGRNPVSAPPQVPRPHFAMSSARDTSSTFIGSFASCLFASTTNVHSCGGGESSDA